MKILYSIDEEPPIPILTLKIYSPRGDKNIVLAFKVDTGFAGGIMLPYDVYTELELTLAEEPYPLIGRFATGSTIKLYRAYTKVELEKSIKFHVYAYSSPYISKKLVGRELLNKLKLLLNGPQKTLEILDNP
ncbi:MAG: hypothetical protein DRJ37_02810 [Thermoprotei archaeon]|nr:MAG: hypothetical protein DRJ37_02810 [Thermoprotei archaeon]